MPLSNLLGPETALWVVAPHADDETLGCGGLIAMARAAGARVYVLFLTLAGYVPLDSGTVSSHAERQAELEAAMRSADITGWDVLYENGRHHCYLDTVPLKELLDWLETGSRHSFRAVRPQVLLLPSGLHSHQDHRQAHAALQPLLRISPANNGYDRLVLEYEIPGMGLTGAPPFQPQLYVPLGSAELEAKVRMFHCYRSQVAPAPHPRSEHAIRTLAAYRGLEAGYPQAEAFAVVRGYLSRHPATGLPATGLER